MLSHHALHGAVHETPQGAFRASGLGRTRASFFLIKLHVCRATMKRPNLVRGGSPGLVQLLNRSEEHTSELQSPCNLVCRLLLEKKNNNATSTNILAPRKATHSSCAAAQPH